MSTKSQKQPQHVLVQMAVSAMATPCAIKLLLFAVPLALGFALGIVATLSLVSSTTTSGGALPGAALHLFFPPADANLSTAAAVPPQHPPESPVAQAGGLTTRAQSPPPPPPVDTGIISIANANKTAEAGPVIEKERLATVGASVRDDDDEELMARAAAAPREAVLGARPKVAFLFLTKWDLPMSPLWEKFFRGHQGRYSVYVHTDPAFNGGPDDDESSAFYRRRIPSKVCMRAHWTSFSILVIFRKEKYLSSLLLPISSMHEFAPGHGAGGIPAYTTTITFLVQSVDYLSSACRWVSTFKPRKESTQMAGWTHKSVGTVRNEKGPFL